LKGTECDREHGDPENSEFTVVKSDAYNGINQYLSDLTCTDIKTVEDIVKYNNENRGTEGAYSGDHQAFPSGQVSTESLKV
jgi:amidase